MKKIIITSIILSVSFLMIVLNIFGQTQTQNIKGNLNVSQSVFMQTLGGISTPVPVLFSGMSYNLSISGISSNISLSQISMDGFYTTVGTPYTNGSIRTFFTIPYSFSSTIGGGWGSICYITNYSGPVGSAGTITNVIATAVGAAGLTGLTEAGSNFFSGFLYSNSVCVVIQTAGTINIINNTNNNSSLSFQ